MSTGTLKGKIIAQVPLGAKIRAKETVSGQMNVPQFFGGSDHRYLSGRADPDQHPMEAITGLRLELDGKLDGIEFMSNMDIQKILDS